MAQSVYLSSATAPRYPAGLFSGDSRINALVACLAVLDMGIWSYVAVAVQLPPAPTPPAITAPLNR
jgi:hypothetical protein